MVKAPRTGWKKEDLDRFIGKCPICLRIIEDSDEVIGVHFELTSSILFASDGRPMKQYKFIGVCEKHQGSIELEKLTEDLMELHGKDGIKIELE